MCSGTWAVATAAIVSSGARARMVGLFRCWGIILVLGFVVNYLVDEGESGRGCQCLVSVTGRQCHEASKRLVPGALPLFLRRRGVLVLGVCVHRLVDKGEVGSDRRTSGIGSKPNYHATRRFGVSYLVFYPYFDVRRVCSSIEGVSRASPTESG